MLNKEPVVLIALLAAIVSAVSEIIRAKTEAGWLAAVVVGAPLVAGLFQRARVASVDTLRSIVRYARSLSDAGAAVADQIELSIHERPAD